MSRVTIQDVAREAGVSIKTVSRVMNREPAVRDQTRIRVQLAIKKLDYRPDPSARRLARKRSFLIGLLYDNPSPSYVTNNQQGVISECRLTGYDLLIHPCNYTDQELDEEIISFIKNTRVDGVILTPPLSDITRLVLRLKELSVAFVCIARGDDSPDVDRVITNDEELSFDMVRHLIALGHRDIGFIQGHPDHRAVGFREKGYRRAMQEAGLEIEQGHVVQGFNSFASGYESGLALLQSAVRPTAIFAANDDMASGVIKAAHEHGLDIPGQLSVAGFDDVPLASQVTPGLTTIRQPIRRMALAAAEMLLRRIAEPDAPPQLASIEGELVLRDSTGKCPS